MFDASEDGVRVGVGSGPILTNAGVGGPSSGVGSRKRGNTIDGVGVLSIDVEPIAAGPNILWVGVGVAEIDMVGDGRALHGGKPMVEFSLFSIIGIFSNAGVNSGIMRFQVELPDRAPGAVGVYLRTISCHCSNRGLGRCRFQSILPRKLRSF